MDVQDLVTVLREEYRCPTLMSGRQASGLAAKFGVRLNVVDHQMSVWTLAEYLIPRLPGATSSSTSTT